MNTIPIKVRVTYIESSSTSYYASLGVIVGVVLYLRAGGKYLCHDMSQGAAIFTLKFATYVAIPE